MASGARNQVPSLNVLEAFAAHTPLRKELRSVAVGAGRQLAGLAVHVSLAQAMLPELFRSFYDIDWPAVAL